MIGPGRWIMLEGLNLIDFIPATPPRLEMKPSSSNGLTGKLAMISAGGTCRLCAKGKLHNPFLNMVFQARMVVAVQRPNAANYAVRKASNGT